MSRPTNTTKQARETTITGKNRITLPAEAIRELGWERDDRLVAQVVGQDMLVLMRRPDSWADFFAGRLGHLFGTHEENLAWLDQERRSWDPEYPAFISYHGRVSGPGCAGSRAHCALAA